MTASIGKKLLAGLLVMVLTSTLASSPLGAASSHTSSSAKQRQSEIRSQKKRIESRIRQLRRDEGSLSGQMQELDTQAADLDLSLQQLNHDLKVKQEELETIKEELVEVKAELERRKQLVAERVTNIYMQGELTYLDLLFNAKDFREFINRAFYLNLIFEKDQELYDSVWAKKEEVTQSKLEMESTITEIASDRDKLQEQNLEISRVREEKSALLRAISRDKVLAEKQIRELEEESKKITKFLRELTGGYTGKWTSKFLKPCSGRISSPYGWRIHPVWGGRRFHSGIDIAAPYRTPIKAGGDGKVVYVGRRGGYGNTVMIDHGGGLATLYAHCSGFAVSNGNIVKAGQVIAYVGSTGTSTGNHLHFEVRKNGDPVDPMSAM